MSDLQLTSGKSMEQLIREDAARQILEMVARRIEKQGGGETYRRAWKAAAKIVRDMKPA